VIRRHPGVGLPALAVPVVILAATASCSSTASVSLPAFDDVSQAPPAIQKAARAVVKVGTAGELATGVFISPTGVLLTNNHVLGVSVCPREGCFVDLTFLYQKDHPPPSAPPTTFFVVPLAIDVGLDMAVVQVRASPRSSFLSTPDYVTIDARDAPSLVGSHINIVGHPEGHLKKWSQGTVIDSSGDWFTTTAFILPGSSGSPLLDDAGNLVGLMHRSPESNDMFSSASVDEYSIGTASAALVAAMAAPLPAVTWSIGASTTDADVVANQDEYLNAHAQAATVGGAMRLVLDSLAAACDQGLARTDIASPDDLSNALAPCTDAEAWIQCGGGTAPGSTPDTFGVCPGDVMAWQARFQGVFDRNKALNGALTLDVVSFGVAALSTGNGAGNSTSDGLQSLQNALAAANAPLDFFVLDYLAAFGATSYQGTNLLDYLQSYDTKPGYPQSGTDIASSMLWMLTNGKVNRQVAISFLQRLAGDSHIELGAKLYVEDNLYQAGAL
jgi:S1-C subfamily serine protease